MLRTFLAYCVFISVLASYGCHNKALQTQWFKATEIHFLVVPEAGILKSVYHLAHVSHEDSGKGLLYTSSWFLEASRSQLNSLSRVYTTLVSAIARPFPLYVIRVSFPLPVVTSWVWSLNFHL